VDFGIAKDIRLPEGSSESDAWRAHPIHRAEQVRSEPVTARTDVYSLGIVLYELLTGEHPYPGLTPVERLFKHLNDPVPKIDAFDPEVSRAINVVIQKATAKNPDHRFSDTGAFAAAFREAAGLSARQAERDVVELLTPCRRCSVHPGGSRSRNRRSAGRRGHDGQVVCPPDLQASRA
jgi:serine/threonine-protein kinase